MDDMDLKTLESQAYRDSFSDGLVDLFVGLGLASIGALWLWFESVAGLAGVFAASIGWLVVPIRRRIVEPRVGYVRWSAPRAKWERRQLWLLFLLGSVSLVLGVGVLLAIVRGDSADGVNQHVVAGLPALLLAIGAFVLAATSGFRRLWAYGATLVIAGGVTILAEAGPGGSLLGAGATIALVGLAYLRRFLQTHPPIT